MSGTHSFIDSALKRTLGHYPFMALAGEALQSARPLDPALDWSAVGRVVGDRRYEKKTPPKPKLGRGILSHSELLSSASRATPNFPLQRKR